MTPARLTVAALAVFLLAVPAAVANPPAAQSLTGEGWEFREDPRDKGLAAGWSASGRNKRGQTLHVTGWEPVSVPSAFDARPIERRFFGTVAWYRLRFRAPQTPRGYAWALRFDQVRRKSVVWLNGRRLGSHRDPYTPFELEARGLRRGMNELVVRVDSRKGDRPREGWWNWGGILRPVTLVPRGGIALHDAALLPTVKCTEHGCAASVRLTGAVRNRTGFPQRGEIRIKLTSPDGTVSEGLVPVKRLPAAKTRVVAGRVPISGNVRLWEPGSPRLYDAEVALRTRGRVEQVETMKVGMRSVSVEDGHLHMNGKRLRLYGASIQEDFPGRGAALTPEDNDKIVAELQQLGANVTRAHYPLNDDLLSKFDAAGIMVWSQAPIYHQNSELNRPAGRNAALATVHGTILATRRHPSVIVNSIANEPVASPDDYPGSRMWLRQAAKLARRVDPSRPVAVDILTYPNVPFQKTYTRFDALGINNYFGWYVGKPTRPTGNFLDLEPYLRKMHRRYPTKAMVMTEFGAESIRSGSPEEKGTYEFQTNYLNRTLDVVSRNDFMGGAIYWTLREFAVKPDWLGGIDPSADPDPDGIHNKALIAYGGELKPAFDSFRERMPALMAPGTAG